MKKRKTNINQSYAKYKEYYNKYKLNNRMTPMLSKSEYEQKLRRLSKDLEAPLNKVPKTDEERERLELDKKLSKNIKKNRARYLASQQTTLEEMDIEVIRKTEEFKKYTRKELKMMDWKSEYYKYNPEAAQEWTDPRTGITHQYTNRQAWYFLMMEIFDSDESMIY